MISKDSVLAEDVVVEFERLFWSHERYTSFRPMSEHIASSYIELLKQLIEIKKTEIPYPFTFTYFTASEWINKNAPHLTRRQRKNFYVEIQRRYFDITQELTPKIKNTYQYSSRWEILFTYTLKIIEVCSIIESSLD